MAQTATSFKAMKTIDMGCQISRWQDPSTDVHLSDTYCCTVGMERLVVTLLYGFCTAGNL